MEYEFNSWTKNTVDEMTINSTSEIYLWIYGNAFEFRMDYVFRTAERMR